MKNNTLALVIASVLCFSAFATSPARAEWWNPSSWGEGLTAVGNFFQAIYMFFYNSGFVIWATVLFIGFFVIEIGLVYIYWRVGAFVYNSLMPALKSAKEFFERIQ